MRKCEEVRCICNYQITGGGFAIRVYVWVCTFTLPSIKNSLVNVDIFIYKAKLKTYLIGNFEYFVRISKRYKHCT